MLCKAQDGVKRLGEKSLPVSKDNKKKQQNTNVSNRTKKLRSIGSFWPITFSNMKLPGHPPLIQCFQCDLIKQVVQNIAPVSSS